MKRSFLLWPALLVLACVSCGRAAPAGGSPLCPRPTGSSRYLTLPPDRLPTPPPASAPTQIEVGGRSLLVDRVVEGPLCNDIWKGTVYVTCNVQVYPWQDQPTFLKDCNLAIEPGTVVYVADHGDEPYYKGCTCHTGSAGP